MKLFKHSIRLFLAIALVALPFASFATDEKVADNSALAQPVKSVLDHYLIIQAALATDLLKGVDENASAIAKAVRNDDRKMLSPDVATQAEALAKATDMETARAAFKPLSNSLIKYLADNKAGVGTYHEAFCPMARASWLQTENNIKNPYMGNAMSGCGEFKN
jgi:hypothetical protein